jgi:hypothetical protein
MNDKPRWPPRFPRPRDDEPKVTRVDEDPIPLTERVATMLPPPPREPFKRLDGRQPSYVEFSAALQDFQQRVASIATSQDAVLGTQRKLALQMDGLNSTINQRFNIFHEELAMLRQTVTGDHAPRIDKVETTLGQKAAKGGGILAVVLLVLPMLAEALPKYAHIFDSLLGVLQ